MSTTFYDSPDAPSAYNGKTSRLSIDVTHHWCWFFGRESDGNGGARESHVLVAQDELPAIHKALGEYLRSCSIGYDMVLPEPPSSNRYWRTVLLPGRGRKTKINPFGLGAIVLLSTAARIFRNRVRELFIHRFGLGAPKLEGRLALHLTWHRSRRAGDLSNRIKQAEDALNGLAYADDAQVRELHVYMLDREEPGWKAPGLDVRVEELP